MAARRVHGPRAGFDVEGGGGRKYVEWASWLEYVPAQVLHCYRLSIHMYRWGFPKIGDPNIVP